MTVEVGALVAAVAVAVIAVATVVDWLRELWGNKVEAPSSICTAELSQTDIKMQEETIEIINEVFDNDINNTIQNLGAADRITKAEELVTKLKDLYDIDVNVEFFGENREHCGYYNYEENSLNLNVSDLLSKNANNVYEFIDTIIHELRHAVQWKAIKEEGFWNVDEQRRKMWVDNISNYIPFHVDPKGYIHQPIEADAVTFAHGCLKGVIENGNE